ncbi:MAG: GspH/FimT family pseudopilin [Magnetococcales bacterium]|nr:GspH/FimT family pseudopilin [Magnetococcales bacterium]
MSSRGFTMLEMLVTLAIMGMLALLAPPILSAALPSLRLEKVTQHSAVFLRQARNLAITENRETAVTINTREKWYRLGQDGKQEPISPEVSVELQLANKSEQVDDDSGMIRFFPEGGSTGGKIELKLDDISNFVIVDWLTGRVKIYEDAKPKG